jgi:hypothetical protein
MAKGQKRSTREVRKPKQEKLAAKPVNPFASQNKPAGNAPDPRAKDDRRN